MSGRPENETIAALDDANAALQLIRSQARQLVDELPQIRVYARRLETIIRATERAQAYLKRMRQLEHQREE